MAIPTMRCIRPKLNCEGSLVWNEERGGSREDSNEGSGSHNDLCRFRIRCMQRDRVSQGVGGYDSLELGVGAVLPSAPQLGLGFAESAMSTALSTDHSPTGRDPGNAADRTQAMPGSLVRTHDPMGCAAT